MTGELACRAATVRPCNSPRRDPDRQRDGPRRRSWPATTSRPSNSAASQGSWEQADPARRPDASPSSRQGRPARGRLPRAAACGGSHGRRDPEGRPARRRDQLRAAQAATARGDARRRRRHLPGDLLRRSLARPRRLPVQATGPPEPGAGVVELRRRRHEARPVRQGRRDPPDVRVRRPARGPAGHRARVARGRSPATASITAIATDEFSAYFRYVRARFDARLADGPTGEPADDLPGPGRPLSRLHAGTRCACDRRRADDHLSIVAGMRRVDTERLVEARRPHAGAARPSSSPTRRCRDRRRPQLDRLRDQARLQLHERDHRPSACSSSSRRDPADPGRGLVGPAGTVAAGTCSSTSRRDPWATEVGLEYLLGVVDEVDGAPRYDAIWGRTQDEEKVAFERFIDLVIDAAGRASRDARLPLRRLRVGRHQAADAAPRDVRGRGRPAAPRRRPGRPAQRRAAGRPRLGRVVLAQADREVLHAAPGGAGHRGRLQRGRVRDLARRTATRRSSTASRTTTATTASRPGCCGTGSRTGAPRPCAAGRSCRGRGRSPSSRTRRPAVTEWQAMRRGARPRAHRRPAAGRPSAPRPRRALAPGRPARLAPARGEVAVVALVRAQGRPDRRGARRRARCPRRACRPSTSATAKASWSIAATGSSRRTTGSTPATSRSIARRGKGAGTIVAIDESRGIIELKRSRNTEWPHPVALIPIDAAGQQAAAPGAAPRRGRGHRRRDRRRRTVPGRPRHAPARAARAGRTPGPEPLVEPGEVVLDAARRLALELDHASCRSRARPGTGKTYAAARMIVDLVAAGRTAAITAQSHKTISNLLEAVDGRRDRGRRPVRADPEGRRGRRARRAPRAASRGSATTRRSRAP